MAIILSCISRCIHKTVMTTTKWSRNEHESIGCSILPSVRLNFHKIHVKINLRVSGFNCTVRYKVWFLVLPLIRKSYYIGELLVIVHLNETTFSSTIGQCIRQRRVISHVVLKWIIIQFYYWSVHQAKKSHQSCGA